MLAVSGTGGGDASGQGFGGMVEKEGVIEFEFGQWNLFIQEDRLSNFKELSNFLGSWRSGFVREANIRAPFVGLNCLSLLII